LRAVELAGMKADAAALAVILPAPVALYVLNQKRDRLIGLEQRYQLRVEVRVDGELVAGEYRLETTEPRTVEEEAPAPAAPERKAAPVEAAEEEADTGGRRRRRRRRRRRKPGEVEVEVEAAETVPGGGMPPATPAFARPAAGEPAGLPADGGGLPAPLEAATASAEATRLDGDSAEPSDDSTVARPRRRTRPRRRRAAPERAARPDAAAGEAAVLSGAGADEDRPPASNGPEQASPEVLGPGAAADAASTMGMTAGRASDNGLDDAAEPVAPAVRPAARRTRRRRTVAQSEDAPEPSPEASPRAEPFDAAPEAEPVPNEPEMAAAPVVVDRRDSGPPRRGWWSRFVRKDE
jgi:ribonuclease E